LPEGSSQESQVQFEVIFLKLSTRKIKEKAKRRTKVIVDVLPKNKKITKIKISVN
jgi:hypothetical protein